MLESRNAAVWANYGEKHTGACLQFKVRETNGRPAIQLNRVIGFSGSGPLYGKVDHDFHQINYTKGHVPIDFFRSLGRLPRPTLWKFWFTDKGGRQSACADAMFRSGDEWRKAHWENFLHGITGKLEDWSYEKEYRLILNDGEVLDFSYPNTRKLKYDFNDLEGIIFGINTPNDKKLDPTWTVGPIFAIENGRNAKR
jgi:Protein of unknown function (DUF2971)